MFGRSKNNPQTNNDFCLLKLDLPSVLPVGGTTEMLIESLHGVLIPNSQANFFGAMAEHISLELYARNGKLDFYIWLPKQLKIPVTYELSRLVPAGSVGEASDDYSQHRGRGSGICGAELVPTKDDLLPVVSRLEPGSQYFKAISQSLAQTIQSREEMWLQILIRPAARKWKARQSKTATHLIANSPEIEQAVNGKMVRSVFTAKIRIICIANSKRKARSNLHSLASTISSFDNVNYNGFKLKAVSSSLERQLQYQARFFIDKGFALSSPEIAGIYNFDSMDAEPAAESSADESEPTSAFEKLLMAAEAKSKNKDTSSPKTTAKIMPSPGKKLKKAPRNILRLTTRVTAKEHVGKLAAQQTKSNQSSSQQEVDIKLR